MSIHIESAVVPAPKWYAATFSGGRVHAATRQACHFGQQFGSDEARATWYAITDANDPDYAGYFTIRVLCARGGCSTIPRVWRDPFAPSGRYPAGELSTCADCAARFSALYAEPVPGWDRDCPACGKTLPVNYFRADKRTRDGLARACTPCWWEQRCARERLRIYGEAR